MVSDGVLVGLLALAEGLFSPIYGVWTHWLVLHFPFRALWFSSYRLANECTHFGESYVSVTLVFMLLLCIGDLLLTCVGVWCLVVTVLVLSDVVNVHGC
jgi:hypothetical protein